MKERLQRIAAWAKAHPWQTALILGAVIFLGYLVYKRSGGGGGGGGGEGGAVSTPESPGPIQSGIPDLGSISSPITGGGLSTVPSNEIEVSPSTGQTGGADLGSYVTGGGRKESAAITPPANLGSFGSDTWAPDFSASVAALTSPILTSPVAAPVAAFSETVSHPTSAAGGETGLVGGAKPRAVAKPSGLKPGQLAKNVQKNNPLAKTKAADTKGKTPAQLVGKGRLFTGYFNGIYYVNGFPVGASPIPGTVTLPGGRVASNQILGIGSASIGSTGTKGAQKKKRK